MSSTVTYKGNTIATIADGGSKTLTTQGKYCEGNITVNDTTSTTSAEYTLGLDERASYVGSDTYWRVRPKINVTTAGNISAGEVIGTGGSTYPTLSSTTITPTTSQQTVGANGTYMLGAITVDAMPTGTVALPTALASSGGATVTSSGTEITVNKSMSIMATVQQAGYVSSVSPSTADVTLRATDANFVDSNIKSGVSIFGKTGTLTFSTIYTGSSAPSSSTGVNGDIYLQI